MTDRFGRAVGRRRACLSAVMVIVAVGALWMHVLAHFRHCHEEPATQAVTAAAVHVASEPAVGAQDFQVDSAADPARTCVAVLIAMCLAVLAIAGRDAPRHRAFHRSRMRASPDRPQRRSTALPVGGRWSFMDLSVLRI